MDKFTMTEEQKEAMKQGALDVLEDVKEVARKAAQQAKPVTDAAKKAAQQAKPMTDAARNTVEQATKRVVMKPQVYVQYNQKEVLTADLVQAAKDAYKAAGFRAAVRSMAVYVKPEENAAYFVINEDFKGKIEL